MSAAQPTILIAGAGVVGLSVAALLATGRCADRLRVRVLEARAQPEWRADQTDLRVYALSRASQRVLDSVGAWQRVASRRACAYRRMHVWEGTDPPRARSSSTARKSPSRISAMSSRTACCAERWRSARGGAERRARARRRDSRASTSTRARRACGSPTDATAQGTLLVAADGSESAIRGMLELPVVARKLWTNRPRDARCNRAAAPRDGVAAILARWTARVPAPCGRAQLGRLVAARASAQPSSSPPSPTRSSASYRSLAPAFSASSALAASARDSRCRRCMRAATARRGPCWWATRRIRFTRSRAKG